MSNLILRDFENIEVSFDKQENGLLYLNATNVAKQFGKMPKDFLRTKEALEYIEALSRKEDCPNGNFVKIVQGGTPELQGTWIHQKLAIFFARWLSADFAIWCDEQIEKILTNNNIDLSKTLNYLSQINEAKDEEITNLKNQLEKALTKKSYNVITPQQHNEIKKMFEEGLSIPKMEKELGLTRNQVEQSLKRQGLYVPNLEDDKLVVIINNNYYYN